MKAIEFIVATAVGRVVLVALFFLGVWLWKILEL